jgi:hypothetical protein
VLSYPCCSELFNHPARTGRARHGLSLEEDIRTAIARRTTLEEQLKGWQRAKKLNLIRTINPEFEDLEQTWGWKMISTSEDLPVTIKCVSHQILSSGAGGRKAPNSMGKISAAEVLRLRATIDVSGNQSVRRSAQDDDFVGV